MLVVCPAASVLSAAAHQVSTGISAAARRRSVHCARWSIRSVWWTVRSVWWTIQSMWWTVAVLMPPSQPAPIPVASAWMCLLLLLGEPSSFFQLPAALPLDRLKRLPSYGVCVWAARIKQHIDSHSFLSLGGALLNGVALGWLVLASLNQGCPCWAGKRGLRSLTSNSEEGITAMCGRLSEQRRQQVCVQE